MTPFTVAIDRNQLFNNVCQQTLYVTENLRDSNGVSAIEQYRLSEAERELYDTLDEGALYDLYNTCQILFKGVEGPLTVSKESFVLNGNLPSDLPVSMVAIAITEAMVNLILEKWFDIRGASELQQKYGVLSEISLKTVRNRILSRNTQKIPYIAY